MAMSRGEARALMMAGLAALAIPFVALFPYAPEPRPGETSAIATIAPPPAVAPGRVFDRPLFGTVERDAAPADAPVLTGIAGRLNRDAVALVRTADGSARTVAVGESVDGWRLESLAIDAAFFTRGRERVRTAIQDEPLPGD